MFGSRYRRFDATGETLPAGDVLIPANGSAGATLLSAEDYELARLFDGTRSTLSVLQEARDRLKRALAATTLEGFVAELAVRGLIHPGSHEPLPPPAHTDEERQALGWAGAPRTRASFSGNASHPPSTMPGSLVQPALLGSLTGTTGARLGDPARIDVPLPPGPFVSFGRWLIWPLQSRLHLAGLFALCLAALILLFAHRNAWLVFGIQYLSGWRIVCAIVLASWLVNFFSMSARAAAVVRYTAEKPRIGISFNFRIFPYLLTDSAGAAERAGKRDRLRVVGAGLVGTAALMVLGVFIWFLTSPITPVIAGAATSAAMASAISLLLRLNPLSVRDGYFLLANRLGILDLRRQSVAALMGYERPWMTQTRKMSRLFLVVYAGLVLLFSIASIAIVTWLLGGALERRLQGTGIVILLAVWGVLMVKQYSRVSVERTTLGQSKKKPWRPTRKQKIVAAVVALVCLIPYPYAPGGGFEVLPRNRADVRALTTGDVREVLAKEGDSVKAGQAIVRIDDTAQRAKVAASEAALASLKADLALTRKGAKTEEIEVARQRVATAKTTSQVASAAFQRIANAYKGKSVTPQEYDRARGTADVARLELSEAQSALTLVSSPAQDERIQSIEADLRRVQAELDLAKEELAATNVSSPIEGRVVAPRLMFARGNYLERGELLATIEDTGELIAEIRVPESSVGEVKIDAKVSAKFWAYPNSSFKGTVRTVAPNAEDGEYGRIVRVQVVLLDPDQRLKAGLTGNAKIRAGWKPVIVVFSRALVRFFMVELWSWIP